jgi:hypothetical protein
MSLPREIRFPVRPDREFVPTALQIAGLASPASLPGDRRSKMLDYPLPERAVGVAERLFFAKLHAGMAVSNS